MASRHSFRPPVSCACGDVAFEGSSDERIASQLGESLTVTLTHRRSDAPFLPRAIITMKRRSVIALHIARNKVAQTATAYRRTIMVTRITRRSLSKLIVLPIASLVFPALAQNVPALAQNVAALPQNVSPPMTGVPRLAIGGYDTFHGRQGSARYVGLSDGMARRPLAVRQQGKS